MTSVGPTGLTTWSGSLHKSFRILPSNNFGNDDLLAFLQAEEGAPKEQVLRRLPYERSRSPGQMADLPDERRYRDLKQVLETCGILWQEDGRIWFTDFGRALRSFMPHANEKNIILIARHAAFALSAVQLRNPTRAGKKYHPSMEVFPCRFIWQAMLQLGHRIASDELNRAVFRTRNGDMLDEAIDRIRVYRKTGNVEVLGPEAISGKSKNDRIIPIVSIASFGWTLIRQKDDLGFYEIKPECVPLLEAALAVPVRHREFKSVKHYVTAVSNAAYLPKRRF